jgi:hypothetical protein
VDQIVTFPVEEEIQAIGVGDIFFNVMIAVEQEEILFIPSHLQNGAVQFFRDLEELHGRDEVVKIAVIHGNQKSHEYEADRKGHHHLAPNCGWNYSHKISVIYPSRRFGNPFGRLTLLKWMTVL